jgi:hypothetical protein
MVHRKNRRAQRKGWLTELIFGSDEPKQPKLSKRQRRELLRRAQEEAHRSGFLSYLNRLLDLPGPT